MSAILGCVMASLTIVFIGDCMFLSTNFSKNCRFENILSIEINFWSYAGDPHLRIP